MTITYRHRFHAGNVGDVWKHTVLLAGLEALTKDPRPLTVIDTHAGEGLYQLGTTGEWSEGVAKILQTQVSLPSSLQELARAQHQAHPDAGARRVYLGSPALMANALRAEDAVHLFELEPETATLLERRFSKDSRLAIHRDDSVAALLPLIEKLPDKERTLVFMDPAWETKAEWRDTPAAIGSAYERHPEVGFVLWYPIKSLTRPNAMHHLMRDMGLPCTVMEVLTTPLGKRRNRLNGSGVVWINPPEGTVGRLAEAAAVLGKVCSTHEQWWSTRMTAWGG